MKALQAAMIIFIAMFTMALYADENIVNTPVQNTVDVSSQTHNIANIVSAKDWGLDQAEWNKYLALKQGVPGQLHPHLTPPELLGYFSDTDEEREHFAEIYAKLEHDQVERELEFNRAFHQAAMKLYSNEPVVRPFNILPYSPMHTSNNTTIPLAPTQSTSKGGR